MPQAAHSTDQAGEFCSPAFFVFRGLYRPLAFTNILIQKQKNA
jgi:hypothetical protein